MNDNARNKVFKLQVFFSFISASREFLKPNIKFLGKNQIREISSKSFAVDNGHYLKYCQCTKILLIQ